MENSNGGIKVFSVDANIFNLANESESIEGFEYSTDNVADDNEMLMGINNQTVIEFLNYPETKVYIVVDKNQPTKLVAYNVLAGESIEIGNLGNHLLAQNEVLLWASDKKKELKKNPNAEIINNDMIKEINRLLFHGREGEVGIGEYRDVDYLGNPANVMIANLVDGKRIRKEDWTPERAGDGRIEKLMDKLVAWTNTEDFHSLDPVERAAMFHAQFIKIHPFRDGNGRTGRMILNYMLAVSGHPLTNIRGDAKQDYYKAIDSAIVDNDYDPLVSVIKNNSIKRSSDLFKAVMNYSNEKGANREMPIVTRQISFNPTKIKE